MRRRCGRANSTADYASAWMGFGPAPRAELLHVLMLPTSSEPSGSASSGVPLKAAAFAELLVDCEEDWTLRAVLVGRRRE
jgi:hypothetical protein